MSAPFPLFLFGGGWKEAAYVRTYWEFLNAACVDGRHCFTVVVAEEEGLDKEETESNYRGPFQQFGVPKANVHLLYVSKAEPLTAARLAAVSPTGVFIAGGATPAYHQALCADTGWLTYLAEHKLPCAGFSAGAVVMPERAILGGWKLDLPHCDVSVAHQNCGEGLEFVEVRAGLGLVPFAVEAHASQWGTLARLIHAVDQGRVPSGWAIDEDTMLKIDSGTLTVCGLGQAYRVRRVARGSLAIDVFRAGSILACGDW